jgi:hypothetical protein
MAQTIKIKRSNTTTAPGTGLASGELAYSYEGATKKLYIGAFAGTGNAALVIGGEYYTGLIDAATDIATNSAIVKRSSTGGFNGTTIVGTTFNKLTLTTPTTGATLTLADNSTLATAGAFSTTLTATAATTLTLPTTGTLATIAGTETLTNKTLTSPTINGGSATSITSFALRDTSAAFDVTIGATSSVTLGAARAVTLDVVNGSRTIKLAGNIDLAGNLTTAGAFSTSGAFPITLTAGASTSVILPASGTLATLAGTETLTNKTLNTGSVWNGGLISGTYGGTGVNNGSSTITIGGNVSFTGAFTTAITVSGATAVTLPTAGTLATLAGTESLTNKTLSTGSTWNGNLITGTYGGTGVNNGSNTITLGGNISTAGAFSTSGAFAVTLTAGAITNVTLPASGTLATLAGTESLTNKTLSTGSVWNGGTIGVAYGGTGTTDGSITGTGSLTFTAGGTNTNVVLAPNGTGIVSASSKRISNVADPTQAQDAATKAYVDAIKTGLDVKDSVRAATIAALTATYSNGTAGVGATLTNSGTQAAFALDGVTLAVNERVLVKNQASALQNGIYTVTTVGTGATNWVLTRATDFDNSPGTEVTGGAFSFIEEGTVNADSGWVCSTDGAVTIGTTGITFSQFSGAGSIAAGDGLTKTGNTLSLAISAAGDGLTYTTGVLAVGGTTNRISVSADAVDISANYVGQSTITTVGALASGSLASGFSTVTVGLGGTGATTFTTNGIIYGNTTSALQVTAAGTWDATNLVGQILSVNASGVPTWTNTIDGGTF